MVTHVAFCNIDTPTVAAFLNGTGGKRAGERASERERERERTGYEPLEPFLNGAPSTRWATKLSVSLTFRE